MAGDRGAPKGCVSWYQHAVLLIASAVVIVLAFLLAVRPDGRVHFRFAPDFVLPHTCASRIVFDAECAGCGLTRSFIYLANGDMAASWNVHRAGWMVALWVAAQIPWRLFQIARVHRGFAAKSFPYWPWLAGVVVFAVLLHWGLRLAGL